MKKARIAIILALGIMLVVGIACGGGGEAAPTPTPTATLTQDISCDIQWNEAKDNIGQWMTVCGPVVDTHYATTSNGKPTFLNIGKPYPNSNRLTVVIWGDDRGNFPSPPENYYQGKNVGVTGLITEYEGIAEIMVSNPGQIEEY